MRCLIGIDLGGTNIAAGAVTQDGRLLSKCSLPTGADRPAEEIVRDMARAALLSLEQAGLERDAACALGVGVPGAVDARRGMVLRTTKALYLFELKLGKSAAAALQQIDLKDYVSRFALDGLPIVKVGINFDLERHTLSDWKIEGQRDRYVDSMT